MSDSASYGALLRSARQAAGLPQEAQAQACGVSRTLISLIEHGKRSLPEELIPRLPEAVRPVIIEAVVREHQKAILRLTALLPDDA
jgi:transcriptional regulator with XRE-family HTH domain